MYYKQLDFLRFVAIFLVILEHWFSNHVSHFFMTGRLGVSLFFTLSGFLITQILLRKKENVITQKEPVGHVLRIFYIRRSLRVFPIYYIAIIFLLIIGYPGLKEKSAWYFLYASNIYSFIQQHWDGGIGPYWSLAVEEQFYLFWPFLILLAKPKHLFTIFMACIVAAPVFRGLSLIVADHISAQPDHYLSMVILTPACIDAFAFGGLLALWKQPGVIQPALQRFLLTNKLLPLLSVACCIALLAVKDSLLFYIAFPTAFAFFAMAVIRTFVKGVRGVWKKIVEFPLFLYLGKISYGIYIYHVLLFAIVAVADRGLQRIGLNLHLSGYISNVDPYIKGSSMVIFLLIIASISYYIIEKPLMNLKKRFR